MGGNGASGVRILGALVGAGVALGLAFAHGPLAHAEGAPSASLPPLPSAPPSALAPTAVPAPSSGGPPWLGVAMGKDDGRPGVAVTHVVRGSPAAKAGLRVGDRILKVGGTVTANASEVTRTVRSHAVGAGTAITVQRDDQETSLRVTFAAAPAMDDILRMDRVGAPAPPWSGLKAVHGVMPAQLDGLRGKVTLVEFWATWCSACRFMGPVVDGLHDRYRAQGLALVGISAEEPERVADHGARHDVHHPLAADPEGKTAQAYGVLSLPTLFVVDKKGIVRDVFVGYDPLRTQALDALVQRLLAESP